MRKKNSKYNIIILQGLVRCMREWKIEQGTICTFNVANKAEATGYRSAGEPWTGYDAALAEKIIGWCCGKKKIYKFFLFYLI